MIIFSLKKSVKKTEKHLSSRPDEKPRSTRTNPPVGDLLSECVGEVNPDSIFSRKDVKYATCGGRANRSQRNVHFNKPPKIRGRNGQVGSAPNISQLASNIANQK